MDWAGETHNLDGNVNFTIHPIFLLNHLHPPAAYPQLCLKAPKGRGIHGTQGKTTDGGILSLEREHRAQSPRKLPPSEPLLREQLVCSCSSCTCISPPGFLFLFSIPTVLLRDLTIPRKLSQAPRKWNQTPQNLSNQVQSSEPWWSKLSVEYFIKHLHGKNDTEMFQPTPCFAVLCPCSSIHELKSTFSYHAVTQQRLGSLEHKHAWTPKSKYDLNK